MESWVDISASRITFVSRNAPSYHRQRWKNCFRPSSFCDCSHINFFMSNFVQNFVMIEWLRIISKRSKLLHGCTMIFYGFIYPNRTDRSFFFFCNRYKSIRGEQRMNPIKAKLIWISHLCPYMLRQGDSFHLHLFYSFFHPCILRILGLIYNYAKSYAFDFLKFYTPTTTIICKGLLNEDPNIFLSGISQWYIVERLKWRVILNKTNGSQMNLVRSRNLWPYFVSNCNPQSLSTEIAEFKELERCNHVPYLCRTHLVSNNVWLCSFSCPQLLDDLEALLDLTWAEL